MEKKNFLSIYLEYFLDDIIKVLKSFKVVIRKYFIRLFTPRIVYPAFTPTNKIEKYRRIKVPIIVIINLVVLMILQLSCKDNGISTQQDVIDTTWVQCQGLPEANVTGFVGSGNNLFAGSYNQFLSQAYIYTSVDNGYNWHLDATFHVYNHDTTTQDPHSNLYLATPVTFINDGYYLLAGIGGALMGDCYISTDQGISWQNKEIIWEAGGKTR